MEKEKIIEMIENGFESEYLDFKLEIYDFSIKEKKQDFLVDMLSMANSNYQGDRYIIIGMQDLPKRIFKGIDDRNKIKDSATYQQIISENIEPSINFQLIEFEHNNLFLIFKIPYEQIDRPYIIKKDFDTLKKGTCRIRKGSQNSFITRYDLDSIYKKKIPLKSSELSVKCLDEGEIKENLVFKSFDYMLENEEKEKKFIDRISEINKINIDDISSSSLNFSFGNSLVLDENKKKYVTEFIEKYNINVNNDFFNIGNAGFISAMIGNVSYTGSKKSKEKYDLLDELLDDIGLYYQAMEYKKELNKLYYLELVLCDDGNAHDELVSITLKLSNKDLILSNDFPVPKYNFLDKMSDSIIEKIFDIKETYNTKEYEPTKMSANIPIGIFGNSKPTYESLVEEYKENIETNFYYQIINKDKDIYVKHIHSIINPNEKILFPCRIFFRNKPDMIQYTITSKLNSNIINKEIKI
ncbi:MAG: ATP-binding protein [Clostridia bacterium]